MLFSVKDCSWAIVGGFIVGELSQKPMRSLVIFKKTTCGTGANLAAT